MATYYINFISDDKMTYSYSAIQKCIDAYKQFSWATPRRKNEFFAIAMELEKFYNFLYEQTSCVLFKADEYNYDFTRFFNAAYDFKNYTVKELSGMLKVNYNFIKNELKDIYRMMMHNEVNTIA